MKSPQPSMTSSKRLDWLDMAKGIGMILVVYGHSYGPDNYYVYLFHMPLFFILSGYLFNSRQKFGTFVLKKFTGLYIPFVGWNFLVILIRIIAAQQNGLLTDQLLHKYLKVMKLTFLTVEKDGVYMGATWFLGSLFVFSIVYKLIDMAIPEIKSKQQILLIIFGSIAIYGFCHTLPYKISRTLILGFFFALGRYLKLHQETLERFTNIVMALLVTVLFWVLSNFTRGNMGKNEYQNAPIFVICALLGSFVVICVSMCIERSSFPPIKLLQKFLRYIGRNTLDILLWQFVAFRFCVALQLGLQGVPITEVFAQESRYYTENGWWFLYMVAGIAIPLIWGWFLRKGPWGWLFKKLHLV